MRLVITAIAALFAGLAAHLLMVFFVLRDPLSFEDVMGLGVTSVGYSLLSFFLVYLPGLFWLRRRLQGCEPAFYFPLFAALVLSLPVAALIGLLTLIGGFFSTGEAILFVIQFVIVGALCGLGFVWHARKRAPQNRPAPIPTS